MPIFRTSQGSSVPHFHIGDPDYHASDLNAHDIAEMRAIVAKFDSAVELRSRCTHTQVQLSWLRIRRFTRLVQSGEAFYR